MIGNQGNNLKIDPSAIAQAIIIALLIGTINTGIQLRQDVALIRDQMNNVVVSKEFAAFKAIAEQHDLEYEKRLERLEKQMENRK
jgi:hypothetical protein